MSLHSILPPNGTFTKVFCPQIVAFPRSPVTAPRERARVTSRARDDDTSRTSASCERARRERPCRERPRHRQWCSQRRRRRRGCAVTAPTATAPRQRECVTSERARECSHAHTMARRARVHSIAHERPRARPRRRREKHTQAQHKLSDHNKRSS